MMQIEDVNKYIIKQSIKRKTVTISCHETSLALENFYWQRLNDIACHYDIKISKLIDMIDSKQPKNLAAAIRLFISNFYFQQIKT